jgi:5-methylcytosine-specific restriction protein A
MAMSDTEVIIESLKPTRRAKIVDLVARAGVDVGPWAVRKDGTPVPRPAVNPSYCYEWAFGGKDGPVVLCIWHVSLNVQSGRVEHEDNFRQAALDLDRAAEDHFKPRAVKQRAQEQARRARRFDAMLQKAFRQSRTIRVVMLDGERLRDGADPGVQSSIVDFRLLDTEPWFVHEYHDATGRYRLVRGLPRPSDTEISLPAFIANFPFRRRRNALIRLELSTRARRKFDGAWFNERLANVNIALRQGFL